MSKPDYDTTIARMAGNIAAGMVNRGEENFNIIAAYAVKQARAIVDEVRRTTPEVLPHVPYRHPKALECSCWGSHLCELHAKPEGG